ncbi:Endonuclease/Exonuclease/phosphatase family protein [compost metagenome]
MRTFLLKALTLVAVFAVSQSYAQPEMASLPSGFCLQNFNAYGPIYAADVKARTEALSRELTSRSACDVIHLQEVWNKSHINQLEAELSNRYLMSTPNKEARIGLMSLFQSDMGEERTYTFHVNNEDGALDRVRELLNVKKAFHVVRADPRYLDEQIYFVNTHLHPTSSAVRVTQLIELLAWRLAHQDLKMVLSGDLNADPDSLERGLALTLLGARDGLYEHVGDYPKGLCTYCAWNPRGWLFTDRVFDYVLFSNVGASETNLVVKSAQINLRGTPGQPLSDHYGVRIDFEFKKERLAQDRDTQNIRRETAAMYLNRALKVLEEENLKAFRPYIAKIKILRSQLMSGEGEFAEYFEKFR